MQFSTTAITALAIIGVSAVSAAWENPLPDPPPSNNKGSVKTRTFWVIGFQVTDQIFLTAV
jgi:hypothetical protein